MSKYSPWRIRIYALDFKSFFFSSSVVYFSSSVFKSFVLRNKCCIGFYSSNRINSTYYSVLQPSRDCHVPFFLPNCQYLLRFHQNVHYSSPCRSTPILYQHVNWFQYKNHKFPMRTPDVFTLTTFPVWVFESPEDTLVVNSYDCNMVVRRASSTNYSQCRVPWNRLASFL